MSKFRMVTTLKADGESTWLQVWRWWWPFWWDVTPVYKADLTRAREYAMNYERRKQFGRKIVPVVVRNSQ